MEDYHVDRTDVEEPQGLKLTVTNCPIGLNFKLHAQIPIRFADPGSGGLAWTFIWLSFAAGFNDLVVLARVQHAFPFRTGP